MNRGTQEDCETRPAVLFPFLIYDCCPLCRGRGLLGGRVEGLAAVDLSLSLAKVGTWTGLSSCNACYSMGFFFSPTSHHVSFS